MPPRCQATRPALATRGVQGNRLREYLDFAAGRLQRVRFWIVLEVFEQHERFRRRRKLHVTLLPERIEIRQFDAVFGRQIVRQIVQMAYPTGFVAAFVESVRDSQSIRELAEDGEVVASLVDRLDGLVHGHDEPISAARGEIVAFERGCRRQHDVGMPSGRRPPRLVDDYRVRLPPGAYEPVEILVMVERVSAGPVNDFDVGLDQIRTLELVRLVGMKQHVRYPGYRNRVVCGVSARC